jgi:hypothetical protein
MKLNKKRAALVFLVALGLGTLLAAAGAALNVPVYITWIVGFLLGGILGGVTQDWVYERSAR